MVSFQSGSCGRDLCTKSETDAGEDSLSSSLENYIAIRMFHLIFSSLIILIALVYSVVLISRSVVFFCCCCFFFFGGGVWLRD